MAGNLYKCFNRSVKFGTSYFRMNRIAYRFYSNTTANPKNDETISAPFFEGADKIYSDKIVKLVNQISNLTLIEVADLNELLKKTLNLPDTPMMQAASMTAAPAVQEEEAAAPKMEKTAFTVRIIKFDESRKVALIKEVKSLIPGMNLVQAKKFVESTPSVVRTDAAKDEAEKLKETLSAVGAIVEID